MAQARRAPLASSWRYGPSSSAVHLGGEGIDVGKFDEQRAHDAIVPAFDVDGGLGRVYDGNHLALLNAITRAHQPLRQLALIHSPEFARDGVRELDRAEQDGADGSRISTPGWTASPKSKIRWQNTAQMNPIPASHRGTPWFGCDPAPVVWNRCGPCHVLERSESIGP